MKKRAIKFVALAVVAGSIIATSCSKSSSSSSNSIVGKWEARHVSEHITATSTTPPTSIFSLDTNYAAGHGNYIEFQSNGHYISRDSASAAPVSDSGSYVYTGGKLTAISTANGQANVLNLSLSGNTFTLSQDTTFNGEREVISETYNRL